VDRGYTMDSVMRGQCSARARVTFQAAEHCNCPLAGTHFPSLELVQVAGYIPRQYTLEQ